MSLTAFKGVGAANDAQKAALGSLIAAQGSQGVESYKAEQAVSAEMAKAGAASAARSMAGQGPSLPGAPAGFSAEMAGRAAQPGALASSQAASAGADFGAYSNLIGQGNANYMDAVGAAAPIVESQTRSEVEQILADLAAKRAAIAAEQEARKQDAIDRAQNRAWDAKDRAAANSDAAAARAHDIAMRKLDLEQAGGGYNPLSDMDPNSPQNILIDAGKKADPKSRSVMPPLEAGRGLRQTDTQTRALISSNAYGLLRLAALDARDADPNMTYDGLRAYLSNAAKGIGYAGGRANPAITQLLAEFRPLFGHTSRVSPQFGPGR